MIFPRLIKQYRAAQKRTAANLRIKALLALGKRSTYFGHLPQLTIPLHFAPLSTQLTIYFQYPK